MTKRCFCSDFPFCGELLRSDLSLVTKLGILMGHKAAYVVWIGRKPGIYRTWDECKRQVVGHKRASYKGFGTLAEAEAAFDGNPLKDKPAKKRGRVLPPHVPAGMEDATAETGYTDPPFEPGYEIIVCVDCGQTHSSDCPPPILDGRMRCVSCGGNVCLEHQLTYF